MPLIQTVTLPGEIDYMEQFPPFIVILDILRASTTMTTALDSGAKTIYPCAAIEEARQLKKQLRQKAVEPLLCGERGGMKIEGFDLGNSPLEYTQERVKGQTLIMATTNGTKTLQKAAQGAEDHAWIGIGAFVNARSVGKLLSQKEEDILFVCSGKLGRFASEDFAGAGFIIDEIFRHSDKAEWDLDDASQCALEIFRQHKKNLLGLLQTCSHGKYLVECGFGEDLPVCAGQNESSTLPVYSPEEEGIGVVSAGDGPPPT